MDTELEHSSFLRQLISAATIFAYSVFIFLPAASAQINGVPASVTSIGFGGNFAPAPGPPASVTSLWFGGQFCPTFWPPARGPFSRPTGGPGARLPGQDYADRSGQEEEPRGSAAATEPVEAPSDQPQTVLVFKDGHQAEIQNYAVVGQTLYALSPGHYRKIALAELDLKATAKENDDRGISFQLPPGAQGN